jgi:hypothetical protein
MKENGDIFVPSKDQEAIAYKLASWYQHEFIPATARCVIQMRRQLL